MNICSKKCCIVGNILYGPLLLDHDMDEIIDMNQNELQNCEAYNEMMDTEGHINYVLPSYCVSIGHVKCLQDISNCPNFMYHSDLATFAIESNQLECLKYILKYLPDVSIPKKFKFKNDCTLYLKKNKY